MRVVWRRLVLLKVLMVQLLSVLKVFGVFLILIVVELSRRLRLPSSKFFFREFFVSVAFVCGPFIVLVVWVFNLFLICILQNTELLTDSATGLPYFVFNHG